MKKKVVALSLVVAMVVMNSVMALGAQETVKGKNDSNTSNTWKYYDSTGTIEKPNGNKKDVTVDFNVTDTAKYSVDIKWGDLQYTYGAAGTWNPSTHSYSWDESSAGWAVKASTSNVINVENHSNRVVYGKYSFAVDNDFENTYKPTGLTATFARVANDTSANLDSSNKFQLPSAVTLSSSDLTLQSNVTVNMDGELGKIISQNGQTVGNVTITLSDQDNIS